MAPLENTIRLVVATLAHRPTPTFTHTYDSVGNLLSSSDDLGLIFRQHIDTRGHVIQRTKASLILEVKLNPLFACHRSSPSDRSPCSAAQRNSSRFNASLSGK